MAVCPWLYASCMEHSKFYIIINKWFLVRKHPSFSDPMSYEKVSTTLWPQWAVTRYEQYDDPSELWQNTHHAVTPVSCDKTPTMQWPQWAKTLPRWTNVHTLENSSSLVSQAGSWKWRLHSPLLCTEITRDLNHL